MAEWLQDTFAFPAEWDWSVLPCNTALLYISDNRFKNYYINTALDFMKNLSESANITAEMVFAEQRLLAMCAAVKGIKIKSLLDNEKLDEQDCFTHIWGAKTIFNTNPNERRIFCIDCIKRIAVDFPAEIPVLEKIAPIQPYFREAMEGL